MSSTTSWLITGTTRGIGYEFVRQLIASPSNLVFATCRNPATADKLKALEPKGKLHILKLDIEDGESIKAAAKEVEKLLEGKGLDYLLSSAATQYGGDDRAISLDGKTFMACIENNVLGPALTAQAFIPLVEKSNRKVIMNMTSGLASIGLDCGVKCASYSIAKTALNMLTYKLSKDRPDLIIFCMDPGWVKTEMGGEGAMLEPEFAIGEMIKTLKSLTPKDTGSFKRNNGEDIPW